MTPEELKARAAETREMARELRKFKYMMNHSYVHAGRLLCEIKKDKRYKDMDFRSMTEFLADPEYGMSKATAYLYMAIYEYFIVKRGLGDEDIMDIDLVRMRAILPIVKGGADLNEWITKARVLGKGDFWAEVSEATGKRATDILPAMPDEDEETVIDNTYVQIVKGSSCCVCDRRPVDAHHFPSTRGAGALEERVIPLCRGCHISYHNAPKDFFWQNKNKIIDWFYNLIDILIKEAKTFDEERPVQDIPMSEVQEDDVETDED